MLSGAPISLYGPMPGKHIPGIMPCIVPESIVTYQVRKDNIVLYHSNRYQVPFGTYLPGPRVRLLERDGMETKIKTVRSHALTLGLSNTRSRLDTLLHTAEQKDMTHRVPFVFSERRNPLPPG